jgi:hypothetical protein
MKVTMSAIAACLFVGATASAQEARMSDRDVKEQFDTVNKARDRFEDALDGQLKRSVIRSPRGEVNVDQFFTDFEKAMDRAKERYTAQYAASTEVGEVLRMGTQIADFVTRQAPGFKGRSEYDRMAAELSRLAAAYGTTFPLPSADAPVRRVGDQEVMTAADSIARQADQFKKTAKNQMKKAKVADATIKQVEAESNAVAKAAKDLKSRVSGNKPASAEARALVDAGKRLSGLASANGVMGSMGLLAGTVQKIESAYGLAPAGTM